MDPQKDDIDEFCEEFQQFGQIVDGSYGFTFTNSTVPLFGDEAYSCITSIAFDHKENLLWVANDQGHTSSFYRSSLSPYSKFWWSVDKNDLSPNEICTTHEGIFFVGNSQICAFTRGGGPIFQHKAEHVRNLCCGHWSHLSPRYFFYGGLQDQLYVFDLEERADLESITLSEGSSVIIRTNDRFLISASEDGQITVRSKDFSKYRVLARVTAHNGGITDFDVFNNYLICCGKSVRQNGITQGDNFMKVYDVRNLKAQTPIGFSQHPTSCRFVTGMEGCVCVSTGYSLFLVDLHSNKATLYASLTFTCDSVVTAASGQAIGVFYNDFSPFVQIFCNSIDPPFSLCDDESVFPSERDLEPFIPFDSDTSLAAFPLVYLQRGQYCSDRWSDSTSFQHFLNTKPTSPEMMEQFKKGVEYFKSPYANTIVSGFNVWSYGKRTAVVASTPSPRQPPPPPSRVEESTSAGAENGAASSANMANSIMERYQNAAEFVPGRQKHQHSRTPDRATSTTPKPPPPSAKSSEAAVENAEAPPKAATCLPSMTFDQLRAMAEALKSEGKATK